MNIRIIFISITCVFQLLGYTVHVSASSALPVSFFQLADTAEWELSLNDFSISTISKDTELRLRVQDRRYLRFSARQITDTGSIPTGPLQSRYTNHLSGLLEYALSFIEQKKKGEFLMDMNWNLYPKSIQKWAGIWQSSRLNEKWNQMDPHLRYQNLTSMISEFLKTDMDSISKDLGFFTIGAVMEKMAFQNAGQLDYYAKMLAPVGILPDLKIPMPLMLSIRLMPFPKENTILDPLSDYSVDSLFAVARKDAATIYCSFNRALDEYEVTGDMRHTDATAARIFPFGVKPYQPIAIRLLNACLRATGGNEKTMFSLRTDLKSYPSLYQEVARHCNPVPDNWKIAMPRPLQAHVPFYRYIPTENDDFLIQMNSFLDQIGYEFMEFQISLDSSRSAGQYPFYEILLKPLGYEPEEIRTVPDIVYLIAAKKKSP